MSRCLVVANLTLDEAALNRTIRDRLERGIENYFIVALMPAPRFEMSPWSAGCPFDGIPPVLAEELLEEDERRRDAVLKEFCAEAEHRLDSMISMIRCAGGRAVGRVHDANLVDAVKDALQHEDFVEVIISVKPGGISRWLNLDPPSRVSRMTKTLITTVVAEDASSTSGDLLDED